MLTTCLELSHESGTARSRICDLLTVSPTPQPLHHHATPWKYSFKITKITGDIKHCNWSQSYKRHGKISELKLIKKIVN